MSELPDEFYPEIRRCADIYEIPWATLTDKVKDTVAQLTRNNWEVHIRTVEQEADRLSESLYLGPDVFAAVKATRRAMGYYWARAGKYKVSAVHHWLAVNKWNYQEFFAEFPITLPKTPEGLIDGQAMQDDVDNNYEILNRALILDQEAEILRVSALGGGDDTWFDYLPDAINVLSAMQSEFWYHTFAFVWNNPHVFHNTPEDEELQDKFEEISNRVGFFLMDYTSGLIESFCIERSEDDTNIYGDPNSII